MERSGPLPGVERHPEQPAAALARGRRPRQRLPHAVEQQQRQHVRLPGPPALLRAPDAPRRPLRARRLGDASSPTSSTASGSTRPTTSCRTRTAATGSPIRRTAASSTRARRTRRAGRATRRAGSIRTPRPAAGDRRLQARAADRRVPRRPERHASTWWSARTRCRIPTGSCFSPDYKKLYVVSTGKGPGDTGTGRQGRHVRVRRRRGQQALQRQALQRLHGRRREVRAGRRALPTSTAISGARATPAATSATAA